MGIAPRQQVSVGIWLALGAVCLAAALSAATGSETASPPPSTATAQRSLLDGQSFSECNRCPEMVIIPAGSYRMGSDGHEEGRANNEGPSHLVALKRPFAVSKYEVTLRQFSHFVSETGYRPDPDCWTLAHRSRKPDAPLSWQNPGYAQAEAAPVVCINWHDAKAKAYVSWLAKTTGKPYRLLSEAEWEYAARAGSNTGYSFGNDETLLCEYSNGADRSAVRSVADANSWPTEVCDDGHPYAAPVGQFRANRFGLYDMHGNAWEWIEDCWNERYAAAPADGSPRLNGDCNRRVLRGGSWANFARLHRSAFRSWANPAHRYNVNGIRVARSIEP